MRPGSASAWHAARGTALLPLLSGGFPAGAEQKSGEDREASALSGFGGVPDLVQVLPPVHVFWPELREQVSGCEQWNRAYALGREHLVKSLRAERDTGRAQRESFPGGAPPRPREAMTR